ncbi:MAG: tetratricopeptide repeat protein [Ferruginibacter sp.]
MNQSLSKYFSINLCIILLLPVLPGCNSENKTNNLFANSHAGWTGVITKISAGEKQVDSISLLAGNMIHLQVAQDGIDIIAKVSSSDGRYKETFDSPTGELGAEDIYLYSDKDMKYKLEISPAHKDADPGNYLIKIVKSGKASDKDRQWFAALATTQNADKLRAKKETRLQSIPEYKIANAAWKILNDPLQYANSMRSMGFVYLNLKIFDSALNVFTELLPIWKHLGDVRSEGFTYLIIGRIYGMQKKYSKSLEFNLNALPTWAKTKDTDQEAAIFMNIGNLYAHLGDKQKSIAYFEQALKKAASSKQPSIQPTILREYAISMGELKEDQKTLALFEQSKQQWHRMVDVPQEKITLVKMAEYFAGKNNRPKAIQYYSQAIELAKKANDTTGIQSLQSVIDSLAANR